MADCSHTSWGGWRGGKVGPSDLLVPQRVTQHEGGSVLPVQDRLLVCIVCYCLRNFGSQEDLPIKKRKAKKQTVARAFKQTKCGTCVHTRLHTHAQFHFECCKWLVHEDLASCNGSAPQAGRGGQNGENRGKDRQIAVTISSSRNHVHF